jgi:hypothetical protein
MGWFFRIGARIFGQRNSSSMKTKHLPIALLLIAMISGILKISAKENVGSYAKITPPSINAACSEATVQSDLTVNNVRCRILLADMWWDLSPNDPPVYEIPKGSGLNSMFAGSLWIGGIDKGKQLKVAAQTYRQNGNDFWPGPLDTSDASVSQDVCNAYDKHFRITRKEVETFVTTGATTPGITSWPGNGDQSLGEAKYLAPFFDADGDGNYNPAAGDYPGYDLVAGDGYGECQENQCIPVDQLFGDETIWWVFNDKGNIHGETGGEPIGLEVRAQAFGFFTDDEINNMTFYNYRIFNRSTFELDTCYFGVWADADLGNAVDDYVGCDVKRGLGFTYNGDNFDDPPIGYGNNPPAIGIDFFRGPVADANDGRDNDRNGQTDEACEQNIMSGFLYYDNKNGVPFGNPTGATHFYNYLKMKWGDGNPVTYGGNGYNTGGPACHFMYPGNPSSDLHDWGTGGNITTTPTLPGWDEVTANNTPADRRMLESAGPFTLMPGAVNVITTGVVWARANAGGAQASVKLLQVVDDKAQALFDNCFKVLDGPTAPDVTIQELDKELILYLSNTDPNSNNYNEHYAEFDPLISLVDENGDPCPNVNKNYNFEGYKIYQLKSATVSSNDLDDPALARMVYQCDVKNGVSRLINYEFDQSLGAGVPKEKVNGADLGLQHSIKITTDAFAVGSPNLINHKAYYFMAVAYGYNEFKKYQQDVPPSSTNMCDAKAGATTGQKKPYKQGRKNLIAYSAIPHISTPYTGGTEIHGEYGSGPQIQRIEGNGNGGMNLDLNAASVAEILSSPDHRTKTPIYNYGRGPVDVRVVDPLNVPEGNSFTLKFDSLNIANSTWTLINNTTGDIIHSDKTIETANEQLLMRWGLSISIAQIADPGTPASLNNGFISGSMTFADPDKKWLTALADKDGPYYSNWIRSGNIVNTSTFVDDYVNVDVDQIYEGVIGGTWAPYRVCASTNLSGSFDPTKYYTGPGLKDNIMAQTPLKDLASVDVVLTSDKSKWTRSVVLEMCEDSNYSENTTTISTRARKLDFRRAPSVDKNGSTATGPDNNDYATGMGWFPGYAINVETGERLNIAFGENSALVNENGNDMLWNPTPNQTAQTYHLPWETSAQAYGGPVYGGQHYIYVFGHNRDNDVPGSPTPNDFVNVSRYDEGKSIRDILGLNNGMPSESPGGKEKVEVFKDAMWVNIPLLAASHSLLETDATIKLRIAKPYKKGYSSVYFIDGLNTFYSDTAGTAFGQNSNLPMYSFTTNGIATHTGNNDVAVEALEQIRAVPNPYYAYSNYETNNLDNRIKITNLPEVCTVSIYNLSGTLLRKFKKGLPVVNLEPKGSTSAESWHDGTLDWDLKNSAGIPISSGVYIIHVEVPGVGEKVVKWFGVMRPIDLDSF